MGRRIDHGLTLRVIIQPIVQWTNCKRVPKRTDAERAIFNQTNPLCGLSSPCHSHERLEADGRKKAADRLKEKTAKSLATAKVVDFHPVKSADATNLTFLDFADGSRGVWKTANPEYTSAAEIRKEVTVYEFDQMLGAGLVPITVERTFKGRKGVVQLFVREIDGAPLVFQPRTLKLFDFLIAHVDRTHTNHISVRGKTIAIDNEGTFNPANSNSPIVPQFDKFIAEQLANIATADDPIAARAKAVAEIAPSLISKDVVNRLKTITDAQWRDGLRGLTAQQLKSFLERKQRALAAIESAERVLGDSLYPSGAFSGLNRNRWPAGASDRLETLLEQNLAPALRFRIERAQELIDLETIHGDSLTPLQIEQIRDTLEEVKSLR